MRTFFGDFETQSPRMACFLAFSQSVIFENADFLRTLFYYNRYSENNIFTQTLPKSAASFFVCKKYKERTKHPAALAERSVKSRRDGWKINKRKEVKQMGSDPILTVIFVLLLVLLPLILVGFFVLLSTQNKLNALRRELDHANTNIKSLQVMMKNFDYDLSEERN